MSKKDDQIKSIFETPLGKVFITLIAVYSFFVAIISLGIDKNIFLFLPKSSYLLIATAGIFFILVTINLDSIKKEITKNDSHTHFETCAFLIIFMIAFFLLLSFLLNNFVANKDVFNIKIILFMILPIYFVSMSILIAHMNCWIFILYQSLFNKKRTLFTQLFPVIWKKKLMLVIGIIHFILFLSFYIAYRLNEQFLYILDEVFFYEFFAIIPFLIFITIGYNMKTKKPKENNI